MVYDEGFEIKHSNYVFFAFFNYSPNGDGYVTDCGSSLQGWYTNLASSEKGCYLAKKVNDNSNQKSISPS